MNARLDISQDGTATVTRPDKAYTLTCRLTVKARTADDAAWNGILPLERLLWELEFGSDTSGPFLDDDGQRIGEWEIFCEAEHECSEP